MAARDTHGQTPFFIAAANGHVRCVRSLAAQVPSLLALLVQKYKY
jgi:ankyrin repeat protein